jgi:O-methyltransferase involved in polyketide biosynthesis
VIETDHPDTLRRRRDVLGDAGIEMQAVSLPEEIDALTRLLADRPATLVCEGVAMYLPARAMRRMLARLAALPSPPRLIFSALDTLGAGGAGFRRPATGVRRWLERHGEPFRWRARPALVHRHLAEAGYVVTAEWDGCGFGEYAIEAEPLRR